MTKNIFKALAPAFVKNHFSEKKEVFFPDCAGQKIESIDIKRVSPEWAKDSCLVRYKIGFEGGMQKVVRGTAKAKSSKEDIWRLMKYLHENLDRSKKLAVPRPLEYLDEINMLFYEEAPGVPLVSLLQNEGMKEKTKAVKMAATWLSWLHNLSPNADENIPNALFIGSSGYKKTISEIEREIPELKELPNKDEIEFVDDIWITDNRIIHNDFYPGNLVISDDIVFGIDFDQAGFGPPLTDLAALFSFFDFSERMWPYRISDHDSQNLKKAFLKEYCSKQGLTLNKTIKEIQPFVVKSFLDQLHYYVAFFLRGREFMDERTRESFLAIIADILVKIRELLTELKKDNQ